MVKIRNIILALVLLGTTTFLPKLVLPKKQIKSKSIKKDYDMDEDSLFI